MELTFREWLREKEIELEEYKKLAEMNEIFKYISGYKEVSGAEYDKYRMKVLQSIDPYYLKQCVDLEEKRKTTHGPRVHYYMYDNFLIYYGKFLYSKKVEIHFLDTTNLESNIIGGTGNYNNIFSVILSILNLS